MKKNCVFRLLLCVLLCVLFCVPGYAQEGAVSSLNTDPNAFLSRCQQAGWSMPEGYTLDGFAETDMNGDGKADLAALIRNASGRQCLLTMMSDAYGYASRLHENLFPEESSAAWGTFTCGLSLLKQSLTLNIQGSSSGSYIAQYVFVPTETHGFLLSYINHIRWDSVTRNAMQNTYSMPGGSHRLTYGTVDDIGFRETQVQAEHSFVPGLYPISLSDFAIETFPTDWDGFYWLLLSLTPLQTSGTPTTVPVPTAAPTAAPKATSTSKSDKTRKCEVCDKWFSPSDFEKHTHSPIAGEKILCDDCGEIYNSGTWHQCSGEYGNVVVCDDCGTVYARSEGHQCNIIGNVVVCDECGTVYALSEGHQCAGMIVGE